VVVVSSSKQYAVSGVVAVLLTPYSLLLTTRYSLLTPHQPPLTTH
jgi:hypothetical protein